MQMQVAVTRNLLVTVDQISLTVRIFSGMIGIECLPTREHSMRILRVISQHGRPHWERCLGTSPKSLNGHLVWCIAAIGVQ